MYGHTGLANTSKPTGRTAPLAAAGAAEGADCVSEAMREAIAGVEGDPAVVLVFPDGSFDAGRSASEALRAAGGAPVAGMTASGGIATAGRSRAAAPPSRSGPRCPPA